MQEPLGYSEWIGVVAKRPFGAGMAGIGLVLSTTASLILLILFVGVPLFSHLPQGRYPRIVLALPFLIGAGLVFLVLSPVFYALYKSGHGGSDDGA